MDEKFSLVECMIIYVPYICSATLPVGVLCCVLTIILVHFPDPLMDPYPHQFATALFSFLYHLASYDAGGEALVSCGMMEALLKVNSLPTTAYPPPPPALLYSALFTVGLSDFLSAWLPALMSRVMQSSLLKGASATR